MEQPQDQRPLSFIPSPAFVQRFMVGAVVLLAVVLASALSAWLLGGNPQVLTTLGYPGLFLLGMLSSGSIFVPVPGLLSVLAAGAYWNPLLAGLAGGLGAATGEVTGYILGATGAKMASPRDAPAWWSWLRIAFAKHAFGVIVLMALIPNPVFDAVGIIAGALRYPLSRFWVACLVGNCAKYLAAAYLGDTVRGWLI